MIRVLASHDGAFAPLAELQIEWIEQVDERLHRYLLRIACEGIGEIQLHKRTFLFPRLEGNTLALMLAALSTLEEEHLRFPDDTSASDLARRFRGTGGKVSREEAHPERHHRPSLWSGQSLEHGGDSGREGVRPEDSQ